MFWGGPVFIPISEVRNNGPQATEGKSQELPQAVWLQSLGLTYPPHYSWSLLLNFIPEVIPEVIIPKFITQKEE